MSETSEIRIGQMSDLHLGCREYGKFERMKDFYEAASKAAEILIARGPDLVLIPGDIFHRSLPYPAEQRQAFALFSIFRKHGIPVVVVRGNHDASYAWSKRQGGNEIHVLQDLGVVTYLEDSTQEIELRNGKRVRVWGLGYRGDDAGAELAALVKGNQKVLSDKRTPNILLLHEFLENFVPSAKLNEYAIGVHGFDYVALGHYHDWWVNGSETMCCTGSTEHVFVTEWDQQERSVAIVTLRRSKMGWKPQIERLTYGVRPKIRKRLDLGKVTLEEARKEVSRILAEIDQTGAVIRLDVRGTLSDTQGGLDVGSIAQEAKKALHVMIEPEMDYAGLPIREDISRKDVMREVFVEKLGIPKSEAGRWTKLAEDIKDILAGPFDSQGESSALETLYGFVDSDVKRPRSRRR